MGSLVAVILSGFMGVPMVYCNWLFISVFSGLADKNRLLRAFVFKMFSGLGSCAVGGLKVAIESTAGKARRVWHHPSSLASRAGR